MPPYGGSAAIGSIYNDAHRRLPRQRSDSLKLPLNQPALWTAPIVRREALER